MACTSCSDTLGGETELVTFWSALDYIGLDIYVSLVNPFDTTPNLQPSLQSMIAEFEYIWAVGLWDWYSTSPYYLNATYRSQASVPLFITESGYPSSNQGLQTPWKIPSSSQGCKGTSIENQTAQYAAIQVLSLELPQCMPTTLVGFIYFVFDDSSNSWYEFKVNGNFDCSWSPVDKLGYSALTQLFVGPSQQPTAGPIHNLSSRDSYFIAAACGLLAGVLFVAGVACLSNNDLSPW